MLSDTIKAKIDPRRGGGLSPMFVAILAYLIGETLTDPEIAEMTVTTDGHVIARNDGDIGFNAYIGHESDLDRNLRGWCKATECTAEETDAILAHVAEMIPGALAHTG